MLRIELTEAESEALLAFVRDPDGVLGGDREHLDRVADRLSRAMREHDDTREVVPDPAARLPGGGGDRVGAQGAPGADGRSVRVRGAGVGALCGQTHVSTETKWTREG